MIVPNRIKGFNFVLINPSGEGKNPMEKGWQKKEHRYDSPKLTSHLEAGHNYGVRGGKSSPITINGVTCFLLILDFDKKELQDKVLPLLPETFTTTSGSAKQCVHLWFASDNDKSFKILDEKSETLCDVLGEGKQIIAPGSLHKKSGNRYSIVKDIPFAFIPYAELEALLKPFDKSPKKKEIQIKNPFVKSLNDDVASKAYDSISLRNVLAECGVDTSKNPTACPLHSSNGGKCLLINEDGTMKCFHCDKSFNKFSLLREVKRFTNKETFEWFAEKAGLSEELKKARREYMKQNEEEGEITKEDLSVIKLKDDEILLPRLGKLISSFAEEIANKLKDKNFLFYRTDLKEIVEIGELLHEERIVYQGFSVVKPSRLITISEKYFTPGIIYKNPDTGEKYFAKLSMKADLAAALLQSSQLRNALPRIDRIFTVPIPIMYKGELTFPRKGYDPRFNSWLSFDAPEISEPNMNLADAKKLISTVFQEFCFRDTQDKINAVAALLTPFLRGIYSSFNTRTPIIFYKANRERAGKDFCAGITGIIYEGYALEESPISNSENSRSNNTEELRKKILAALIAGRKRLHFSNNKGFIDNAVLEAITTAERFSDRLLGRNEILSFDNELDLSMSGNLGVTFTPDLANRCRFINLFLDLEDANSRSFINPCLHTWLKSNRNQILSALYALIKNWIDNKMPSGKIPFASFPEWARVCGGIMESAGYGSPCTLNKEMSTIGGDAETQDMKVLFELCYAKHAGVWVNRNDIIRLINDEEIFSYLDFGKKEDLVKFGKKMGKFIGRVLSEIRLIVDNAEARGSRQKYKFIKDSDEVYKEENVKKDNKVYINSQL